ncbi:hypothetical protein OC834_006889 [Tilletia horrida]|nr:hypothetical protein OC834_006889 [Tilletia horrida]
MSASAFSQTLTSAAYLLSAVDCPVGEVLRQDPRRANPHMSTELWLRIVERIRRPRDVISLATTGRHLHAVCSAYLYTHIYIPASGVRISQLLETLLTNEHIRLIPRSLYILPPLESTYNMIERSIRTAVIRHLIATCSRAERVFSPVLRT